MSVLLIFLINDCLPLSGFTRGHIGYPSIFVIVSLVKSLWRIFVHYPSAMQGDERLRVPHGSWVMFAVTISNSSWLVDGSGIFADMILSNSSGRFLD